MAIALSLDYISFMFHNHLEVRPRLMKHQRDHSFESSSEHPLNRRGFLAQGSVAVTAVAMFENAIASTPSAHAATACATTEPTPATQHPLGGTSLKYCLNTSTIHGEVVPLVDQITVAQKAGYDSMELWLRDIDKYLAGGGTLGDLRKRIADAGLTIESSIAFALDFDG